MKIKSYLCAILAFCISTAAIAEEVVLIVNSDSAITSISARDAMNIYLGKKSSWSNGTTVVPFSHGDDAITGTFARTYVKKSAQQLDLYWRKLVFTGKGTPPEKFSDSKLMKRAVASRRGAIGYILKSELDGSVTQLNVQ